MIKFEDLLDCNSPKIKTYKKNRRHNIPWVDKYRPSKLSDIVYQTDVTNMLKEILKTGNMPHLLFYGNSGTGKTSTILAAAMDLFGPKKYAERVIELNASDERGINIVRNKIVMLAKSTVSSRDPNYLCPPYKIIVLDEADAMTTEAQSALRKIMEDHSAITRFCFICNYINQIIDPIISRCVKFRFKPIDEINIINKLKTIIHHEKVIIDDFAISTLANIVNGDMRKAIMILQNLSYLSKSITVDDVNKMANIIPIEQIKNTIYTCIDNSCSTINICNMVNELTRTGYPINTFLEQLVECIIDCDNITDEMKAKICLHISKTEKRLIDGGNEYLQLLSIYMCIKSTILNFNSIYTEMKIGF